MNRPSAPHCAIIAVGFSAAVTQLVFLRELLCIFSGNELGLAILLGNWLLLMGAGTWAGRSAARLRNPVAVLAWALMLLALYPPLAVFLARWLRTVVLIRGVEAGIAHTALGCFAVLLPYCVASGYALALACAAPLAPSSSNSDATPLSVGNVYFLDATGSIAGGVLFTFVLVRYTSPFGALAAAAFLCLLAASCLARNVRLAAGLAAALLATALALGNLEMRTAAFEHPGAEVLFTGQSPYGKLVVTETAGQINFFENGAPLFSTQNPGLAEEKVHYAMAQRPDAKHVLLLSGGVSGTTTEILKYGVQRVDYVELDPMVVAAGRRYAPEYLDDPRIAIVTDDARSFARRCAERYDIIILDLPAPATARLNGFYTCEFYRTLKSILAQDGVICFGLAEYADTVTPELTQLVSTAHTTLKQVFANVFIVPNDRLFFLSSDGPLSGDIAQRIEERGIQNRRVKHAFLKGVLTEDRLADMQRLASADATVNEDLNPVLYYQHLQHWMAKFQTSLRLFQVALVVLLVVALWRARAVPAAIFAAGFAGSALEIVLLLGFQIALGSVYQKLGLLITAFMAGLAAGSAVGKRERFAASPRNVALLAVAIGAVSAALPVALRGLAGGGAALPVEIAFCALAFMLAAVVGLQFAVAGREPSCANAAGASRLYTADFLGASLGALGAGTLLIPLLGVANVCWLTAGVNVAAGVVVWASAGRGQPQ